MAQVPKILNIPKNVCCPKHGKEIQWLNLNPNYLDDERLFCVDCKKPNNINIISYKEIMERIQIEKSDKIIRKLQEEFLKVKEIIISQLAEISHLIEFLQTISETHPISTQYQQFFLEDRYSWDFMKLLDATRQLSNKVRYEKNNIEFISDPLQDRQEDLKQITKCIKIFQQCSKDIADNANLQYPTFQNTYLRQPTINLQEQEVIKTVKYELVTQQKMPKKISALLINWQENFIAAAQNEDNNDILIWEIDKKNTKISIVNTLKAHQFEITILDCEPNINLISVDKYNLIIFWSKYVTKQTNHFQRLFNVQMEYINCIKFHSIKNYLAVGGNQLQIWRLNNTPDCHIDKFDVEANCLCFNKLVNLLVTGNNQGQISVFQFKDQWEQIHNLNHWSNQILFINFISPVDFVAFQDGFIRSHWVYDETLMEYESKEIVMEKK